MLEDYPLINMKLNLLILELVVSRKVDTAKLSLYKQRNFMRSKCYINSYGKSDPVGLIDRLVKPLFSTLQSDISEFFRLGKDR